MSEALYTTSLHWKHNNNNTSPAKQDDVANAAGLGSGGAAAAAASVEKRPIDLPNDVEHITEVEWADDVGPAATHQSTGTSGRDASGRDGNSNGGGNTTTNVAQSMVTNLEKDYQHHGTYHTIIQQSTS